MWNVFLLFDMFGFLRRGAWVFYFAKSERKYNFFWIFCWLVIEIGIKSFNPCHFATKRLGNSIVSAK